MIPKIIHFVWVGDQPKSDLVLKCIESWKRILPDWNIMEWGNESLKSIDNQYVQEAFFYRKWAFVADYLRLHALSRYGGVYLDADTEVTQDLTPFLDNLYFSGFECVNSIAHPFAGVIGSIKDGDTVNALLSLYDDIPFVDSNGDFDITTSPVRYAHYYAEKYGFIRPLMGYDGTQTVKLADGILLYPYSYFCSKVEDKPNYAIHHFAGSWCHNYDRKDKFQLLGYKLIRMKRKKPQSEYINYPLKANEKVIFKLTLGKKHYLLIDIQ